MPDFGWRIAGMEFRRSASTENQDIRRKSHTKHQDLTKYRAKNLHIMPIIHLNHSSLVSPRSTLLITSTKADP